MEAPVGMARQIECVHGDAERVPMTAQLIALNWGRASLKARISVGQTKVKSLWHKESEFRLHSKTDVYIHRVEEEDNPSNQERNLL